MVSLWMCIGDDWMGILTASMTERADWPQEKLLVSHLPRLMAARKHDN